LFWKCSCGFDSFVAAANKTLQTWFCCSQGAKKYENTALNLLRKQASNCTVRMCFCFAAVVLLLVGERSHMLTFWCSIHHPTLSLALSVTQSELQTTFCTHPVKIIHVLTVDSMHLMLMEQCVKKQKLT
jgi:hypothetical protein